MDACGSSHSRTAPFTALFRICFYFHINVLTWQLCTLSLCSTAVYRVICRHFLTRVRVTQCSLSIAVFHIIAEEIHAPTNALSSARQGELVKSLTEILPVIMPFLTEVRCVVQHARLPSSYYSSYFIARAHSI